MKPLAASHQARTHGDLPSLPHQHRRCCRESGKCTCGADVHLCRSKGKHALTDCRSGVSPCTYDEIGVARAELNLKQL